MKNSLKIGLLGIFIAGTVVACDPPKENSGKEPGDSTHKAIDTASKAVIDSTKKDTAKKP